MCCTEVGGQGNSVDVTDAEQGIDVRFVRLRGQGVTEEDHRENLTGRNARAHLQVTTKRSRGEPFDLEVGRF